MIAALRAPLFVPADRADRFAKAAASGADSIILDLEDAVAPDGKDAARSLLATDFTALPVIVRINAAGTPWHEEDLRAVARLRPAGIMLPKAEAVDGLAAMAAIAPLVALVETARGIAAARSLAACGQVGRIAFGSVDYAADLGCAHERESLAAARAELVLAARLGGLPAPLDGVTLALSDHAAAGDDAAYARRLGFGGKLLIHPGQVEPVLAAFQPSEQDLAWARRVLAEPGAGAVMVEGEMVDEPVRRRARDILARAAPGRSPPAG